MRTLLISLFCLALVACGSENSPSGDDIGSDDSDICPASAYMPFHQMNLFVLDPIPARVAVWLNGTLKYDECQSEPTLTPPAPAVTVRRLPGELDVHVLHMDAYPALPSEVTYEIMDRRDCLLPPIRFFYAERVPLEFKRTFPDGPKCGSAVSATVDLIR